VVEEMEVVEEVVVEVVEVVEEVVVEEEAMEEEMEEVVVEEGREEVVESWRVAFRESNVLYANLIAHFVLTFLRQHSLNCSVWGNPLTFGLAADSMLNTLGTVLLCGVLKDVSLPYRLTAKSNGKVAAAAPEEQIKELGFSIDSHACSPSVGNDARGVQSDDVAASAELSVPENPTGTGAGE
jgi:hypothetical protein